MGLAGGGTVAKPKEAAPMTASIDQLSRSISLDSAANDFLKVAKVLAASSGLANDAQRLAQAIPSSRVREVIENRQVIKSPVSIGTLTSNSAIAAYQQLAAGFFGALSEFSAYSRIYNANDFYRVPLRTIIAVLTSAPVAEYVSELSAKSLSAASFATATLDVTKVSSMVVLSNELARSALPAAILQLGQELRRAASIEVDNKFLSLMAATPGITTAASTGTTAAQVLSDLTAAVTRLTIGAESRLWWIVSPKLFKIVSLLQGTGGYLVVNNKIGPISLAPSDAATTVATLIDAKGIATELDTVAIDSTTHASLQLDSDPTSGAYHLVSLWQNNCTGLRCEVVRSNLVRWQCGQHQLRR
jgi:HK97 family phage major capsid protein